MPQREGLARAGLGVLLFSVLTHTRADPDLWGHVLFGRDIVSSGRVVASDVYSFTSDRAWINHEWLAECAMYLAYAAGGGIGLAMFKVLVALVSLGVVWRVLKASGIDAGARDLLIALSVIGIFPQVNHVRPQIFSILAFSVLLALLAGGRSSPRLLWLVPPIFAAWVNLHGGWIVGGGVLAIWAVSGLAGSAAGSDKARIFVAGVASLAATLANPWGWGMWQFLWDTVGFGRAEITDWQPVYRLGPGYVALWLLLAAAAVAGSLRAWKSAPGETQRVVVVALLGLASFQVMRLTAFFAIAIVVLLGPQLAEAMRSWRRPTPAARQQSRTTRTAVAVVTAALFIGAGRAAAVNVSCIRMDPSEFPEPEVIALARDHGLTGRLAVWFDWGEYAIWHLSPEVQVSIDGRRETVYSEDLLDRHLRFYYVPSTRGPFLSDIRPDHIWLPPALPVVPGLLEDGWLPTFAGERSTWLSRRAPLPSRAAEAGSRCFPGP